MTPFIISGNPFQDETYLITKQMDFPTFFILNPISGKINVNVFINKVLKQFLHEALT